MSRKPTYEELEQQVGALQKQLLESKEAEEALQDSEERFRDLAELLPQIIFEMDKDGVLTFVNQQALKMTGYSQEDFKTGFEGIRLLVPEDRQRATGNIIDIMAGREAESHEYTAQRKDGSVFPVIAHSTAIMRDGKPSGIRGIIFDVTDQKRAEETLRQRESALEEKTNELKEVNDALRFLLRQRNRDKANME
jgi:two-component system NtrC family sensor kinase